MGCGTAVRSPIRSSISCSISMSRPGTLRSILRADLVHDLLDAAARQRLEADEEVALVGLGDAAAQLQAGAPGVGLHLGRVLGRIASTWRSSRSVSASDVPGGGAVVEDEAALVHRRHEARAGVLIGEPARQPAAARSPSSDQPRARQQRAHQPARRRRGPRRSGGRPPSARRPSVAAGARPAAAPPARRPGRR